MAMRFWLSILFCASVPTLSHDSAENSPQTQRVAMVAEAVAMATLTINFVQKRCPSKFGPLLPRVSPFQRRHMTQHRTLHTHSGLSLGASCRYGNNYFISCPKLIFKQVSPVIYRCATVSTLSHDSALNFLQTQWVSKVAQPVAMMKLTSNFVQKPCPSIFDRLLLFVMPFQHCHVTQHQIFHKPIWLIWWHKPLLWQQWRHTLSKNHGQAVLTAYSFLCHSFNIVTCLSICFPTNLLYCHGGTSRYLATMTIYLT